MPGTSNSCKNANCFSDANIRQLHSLQDQGKALVIVALSDKVIGVIALSDAVRTDVPQMLNDLQRNNTDVIVLTGDNSASARYFAQKSGIKHIYADLLPETKLQNKRASNSWQAYLYDWRRY